MHKKYYKSLKGIIEFDTFVIPTFDIYIDADASGHVIELWLELKALCEAYIDKYRPVKVSVVQSIRCKAICEISLLINDLLWVLEDYDELIYLKHKLESIVEMTNKLLALPRCDNAEREIL